MQAQPLSRPAARSTTDLSPNTSSTALVADANQISSSISESTRGLAHDAGNLLLALGLYSDLLRAPGVLQPQHRHYAEELELLGKRSESLLGRLLGSAAKTQAQTQTQIPTPSNRMHESRASDILRRFAPLLHGLARPFASVSIKVERGLPPLPLPAEVLERILTNLVRNAAEAIASTRIEGGSIRVRLTQESGELCLRVTDDGPGLSPAAAEAFRSPTPLPANAARGLGHRIIHELITETGGRLSTFPAPGGGTTVVIAWPLFPPAVAPATLPSSTRNRLPSFSLEGAASSC